MIIGGIMEQYLIYAGVILGGLSFILLIIENLRLNGMIRKYKKLIRGLSEKNVEDLMVNYSRELENVKDTLDGRIEERISDLEAKMPTCLRNQGMLTYNAFDNMGNNMSFSIGAVDDQRNGFVITGIYSREHSYVYAKKITEGQPDKELSKEEKEVLAQALKEK
jgi:hypothetical protein